MPNKTQFACQECDLLLTITALQEGEEVSCPRCGHHVLVKKINSIPRTLALSLSGLLIFIPAMTLPLMTISSAGLSSSASLWQGITSLWYGGLNLVAIAVFLFCLLAPLCKLLSVSLAVLAVKYNFSNRTRFKPVFKFYHFMDSWEMLEVFMIGILVSVIKLKDMAELSFGAGIVCFTLLMLIVVAIKMTLDKELIWRGLHNE